jgi:hypothetical protein
MNEELLAETLGEDTTSQLYRDAEGGYHIRVMALPREGGEKVSAGHSPQVFQDRPVTVEVARALFGAAAAKRYTEQQAAFPPGR